MIDFLTLFLMTLFAALSVTGTLSVFILFGPLHLPFLCLVGYLIYRMFKCCSCCYACVTQNVYKSSTDDENNPSASPSEALQSVERTVSVLLMNVTQLIGSTIESM